MSDLISKKAAIEAINTWDKFGVDERSRIVRWCEGLEPYVHLRDVVTAIVNLPSAQPEIIRCKDCKWSDWYTALDGNRYCYCMETGNGGRTEDDYCSYAERETDA